VSRFDPDDGMIESAGIQGLRVPADFLSAPGNCMHR